MLVSADQFPGLEDAMVRVYASDGLLTAQATSAPFRIDTKAPQVVINFPGDNDFVPLGMPILLSGLAYDYEDGMLPSDALSWHSNLDGSLGTGEKVMIGLSPGLHILTLTAVDSQGNSVIAQVNVFVGAKYDVYLPVCQR